METEETTRQTFASVWDAIADTPGEAANLRLQAELILKLHEFVRENGLTEEEFGVRCGIPSALAGELIRGRFSKFCFEDLVNMATALGWRVRIEVDQAPDIGDQLRKKFR